MTYDHMQPEYKSLKRMRKADKRRDWLLYLALGLLLLASCKASQAGADRISANPVTASK